MRDAESYWETPEKVNEFAGREADLRLQALSGSFEIPGVVRVLDLGCAGGRNTTVLAERGFDFYAVDSSAAMVARTRDRVGAVVGVEEASRRVSRGRMDDLTGFDPEFFDVIVALGIYHNATSEDEFERSLAESSRVLRSNGQLLVSSFSPSFQPEGEPLTAAEGMPHVFDGFGAGPMYLLEAADLDQAMSRHGLQPSVPTETVVTQTESGTRVTINALYHKLG
jgi:SAM-dependent methyltransferase